MEFIELADYCLPAGHVTEWLPTAGEHWADWPRDARAVSHNHEYHLRAALEDKRNRNRRQCWLGHAVRIDGPLDAAAWGAALGAWVDRHEVLRSHVTVEGGRTSRYTLPPGAARIRAVDAGYHTSIMSAYRLVHQLLDDGTSALDWPSHLCVTIAGRDSFTAIVAADHAVMDGYSTTFIGGELRALYDAARNGRPAGLPESASYLDFCRVERDRAGTVTADHPAVEIWREFLAGSRDYDPSPRTLSSVAGRPVELAQPGEGVGRTVSQRNLSMEVLDAKGADRVASAAREHGQGLVAALMAAFAAAQSEQTGAPDFRTVMPLHTRDEPRWRECLGWFVGLAPYRIDCTASTLADLVAPAGTELRRVSGAATVPFARVCELLDIRPRISFMVSYMDIRGAIGADHWIDSETRWLRSRTVSADEFYCWFLRTPAGVTLNMRYPGTTSAARDVHRHMLRLRELLEDYARHGDAHLRLPQGASTWR